MSFVWLSPDVNPLQKSHLRAWVLAFGLFARRAFGRFSTGAASLPRALQRVKRRLSALRFQLFLQVLARFCAEKCRFAPKSKAS